MFRTCLMGAGAFVLMAQAPAYLAINGRILGPQAKPIPKALVTLIATDNRAGQ